MDKDIKEFEKWNLEENNKLDAMKKVNEWLQEDEMKKEHKKWMKYEIGKSKIKEKNLSPKEYEKEIKKLVKKLKI